MTITPLEEAALNSELALLWQRHRQTNLDRISLLEMTAANVLRSMVDATAVAEGVSTAHKLAGSLGTFGFDAGSRAALEAESLLREKIIDGRLLAEAVTALRSSVEEVRDASGPDFSPVPSSVPTTVSAIKIVSCDTDLVSRLAVEATAIGLVASSTTTLPVASALSSGMPGAIVVDATGPWTRSSMLKSIAGLTSKGAVIVLTDNSVFEDRVELAKAGVAGVIPRSQGARQTISFVAEVIDGRKTKQSTALGLNITGGLLKSFREAITGLDCSLEILDDPAAFWMALEDRGADVVIVGFEGQLSGPDLCRVIRTRARWHRLPILVVGEDDLAHLEDAMRAGADDYLSSNALPRELGIRLRSHLERGHLDHARRDIDPFTGTENRASAEHSFDRLLSLAARRGHPLGIALLTIDNFDQIRETEGNALGDLVLRRLGSRLQTSLRGEDIVGRWTHDGFAVGLCGTASKLAIERITEIAEIFADEIFFTTSGALAQYTVSAGVASTPADGTRLSTLVQHCEAALRRAKTGKNRVVVAGERPAADAPNVVDVVLVEDDDTVADVIEHALGLRQYSFVRFADGAEAARELGGGHVKGRVVLLDVGLPSLDGFGVLQTLRGQSVLDDTRVIMLTARSSEPEMLRALGLGATEHITKPFSVPVLLGRLGQTLVPSAS